MKSIFRIASVVLVISSLSNVFANEQFPKNPQLDETPGALCKNPTSHRYPEGIAYCERNVDTYTKNSIIQKYDSLFGYHIRSMKRLDFKIDHLIPLCAGGANVEENLWPQHKSIYNITDPLEPLLCQKMQEGKLSQADAVKMVIDAKTHLEKVRGYIQQLNSL